MRKVAGGEASAVPHTTFVGHSARQASTNPMILKQAFPTREPPIEEGPPPMQPEAEAEGAEGGSCDCPKACMLDKLYAAGMIAGHMGQGEESGGMGMDNPKADALAQAVAELMAGSEEEEGEESLHSALSRLNLRYGPQDEPGGPI